MTGSRFLAPPEAVGAPKNLKKISFCSLYSAGQTLSKNRWGMEIPGSRSSYREDRLRELAIIRISRIRGNWTNGLTEDSAGSSPEGVSGPKTPRPVSF